MDRHSNFIQMLTVFLFIVVTATCLTSSTSSNSSNFPGQRSGSRLAYYRWRVWLLSRLAVTEKVPPMPTMSDVYSASYATETRLRMYSSLSPASVFMVDAADQTMQVSGRLMLWWKDSALAVDQNLVEEFTDGNVTLMPFALTVPLDELWLPDIVFVEGSATLSVYHHAKKARVLQDGTIKVILPIIQTFSCRFNMHNFPFDEHHCPITLYDMFSSVDIFPSGLPWDTDIYQKFGVSGEWDLVNVTEKTLSNPSEGGLVYPSFVLHLRRKTTFYSVVMLFPMVLTSYLNVLVFLLPPDLGDKASYLVTLTVSMSVYVAFFNTDMPRGLDCMPRIFVLLLFVYAESFCILLMCLAVLKKYAAEKGSQEAETTTLACIPMKRSRVFPSDEDEGRLRKPLMSCVSAKQLDIILFVTAFVINTGSMAFILTSLNDEM